jgi:hypothetical protein
MGMSEDATFARETLEYAIEHARDQDVMDFFMAVRNNNVTRRVAVEAFKTHYDEVSIVAHLTIL